MKLPNTYLNPMEEFLDRMNSFEQEIRWDLDFKAEMHLGINQLNEQLLQKIQSTKLKTEEVFQQFVEDKWIEEKTIAIALTFQSLLKAESERHCQALRIIHDFYKDGSGKVTPRNFSVALTFDLAN
jgi:hypothetical protein